MDRWRDRLPFWTPRGSKKEFGCQGLGMSIKSFIYRSFVHIKTGAPVGIRTQDPLLRRQMLYPTELRALLKE